MTMSYLKGPLSKYQNASLCIIVIIIIIIVIIIIITVLIERLLQRIQSFREKATKSLKENVLLIVSTH